VNDFPELWGAMLDPNALLPSGQLYDVNGKPLFSIGRNFSERTYQMCCRGFMAEVADRALFRSETLAVEREGDYRHARCGDKASYLRGIRFRLRAAWNKTIVRGVKDARRVPAALIANRIANDAPAAGSAHSRVNLAKR